MHQTRQQTITRLQIPRKGTKYVARARRFVRNSVPIVIAVRDLLHLAKTANEVKKMIRQKMLKINGRIVRDYKESICLFNHLEAGKVYCLTLLTTGKFVFEAIPEKQSRMCKVVNKRLIAGGAIQLNLHDGTNILTKEKINVGDSLYLGYDGKIIKHIRLEKGNKAMIISGKHQGRYGVIDSISEEIDIDYEGGKATLKKDAVVVI